VCRGDTKHQGCNSLLAAHSGTVRRGGGGEWEWLQGERRGTLLVLRGEESVRDVQGMRTLVMSFLQSSVSRMVKPFSSPVQGSSRCVGG